MLTLEFSLFLEGVSRFYYGKGAEGNGETPVGIAGQLRPHRAVLEEAQRPPHGKRSFSRSPLNSPYSLETESSRIGSFSLTSEYKRTLG